MKALDTDHIGKLKQLLRLSATYFLFPLGKLILNVCRFIYRHKIKLSATFIVTPIAVLSFYYAYFITPDAEYFSKKRGGLALERVYVVYMNISCDQMEKTEDEKLKKWHEKQFISDYQKLTEVFADYVATFDKPDREGPEIYLYAEEFEKYIASQIEYVKENKACPSNRHNSEELRAWELSITSTFPSTFDDFNRFYYKKYNLHKFFFWARK